MVSSILPSLQHSQKPSLDPTALYRAGSVVRCTSATSSGFGFEPPPGPEKRQILITLREMTRADGIVDEAEVAKKVGGLTGPEGRRDVPTTTMQLTSDVADDDDDEDDDVVVIDVLKKTRRMEPWFRLD